MLVLHLYWIVAALLAALVAVRALAWCARRLPCRLGIATEEAKLDISLYPKLSIKVTNLDISVSLLNWLSDLIRPYCPLQFSKISCRSLEVIVTWSQIVNKELPVLKVVDSYISTQLEHTCHWSIERAVRYANSVKHAKADYLTAILNKTPLRPEISMSGRLLDFMIAEIRLDVTGSEIRIVDDVVGFVFGIVCEKFTLTPCAPSPATLFAVPRVVDAHMCRVYLNPTTSPQKEDEIMMSCEHIHNSLEFPDIWGTMLQPGMSPLDKGKRIRLSGHYYHCVIKIQEEQMSTFLNSVLKAVGIYEYYPYLQRAVEVSARYDRTTSTMEEAVLYCTKYKLYLLETNVSSRKRLLASILTIQDSLSLACIMSLRRRVLDWQLDGSYYPHEVGGVDDRPPGPPRDLAYSSSDSFDDHAMSNYLCERKPLYDDAFTPLREVLVEISASGLIFSLFRHSECSSPTPSGAVNVDISRLRRSSRIDRATEAHSRCCLYQGRHWGLLSGNTASASARVLLCLDHAGVRTGATSEHFEPDTRWVEIKGTFGAAFLEVVEDLNEEALNESDVVESEETLVLLSHGPRMTEENIIWSLKYDSSWKSYYNVKLSECCLSAHHWKHWKTLVDLILSGLVPRAVDRRCEDVYPEYLFEAEKLRLDSSKRKLVPKVEDPSVPAVEVHCPLQAESKGLMFNGWRAHFLFEASELNLVLNCAKLQAIAHDHKQLRVVTPLLVAAVSGSFSYEGEDSSESFVVDMSSMAVYMISGHACYGSDISKFYNDGVPIFLTHMRRTTSSILNIESFHLRHQISVSDVTEGSAKVKEAKEMVSDCWGGKLVRRVSLKLDCEDYFNSHDSNIFDSNNFRAVVMLQLQILRKSAKSHLSNEQESTSSHAHGTNTLKHTMHPFEGSVTFDFLTTHEDDNDDFSVILELSMLSEQRKSPFTRTILGSVTTSLEVTTRDPFDEPSRAAPDGNRRDPSTVAIILPVSNRAGENFIRIFQTTTYPLLQLTIKSLRCLMSLEDQLEANGCDDIALTAYVKVSLPIQLEKENIQNDENAKYYDQRFVSDGAPSSECPKFHRTSRSCSLRESEGDIVVNDSILLPVFTADEVELLFELIVEGAYYSSCVGSFVYKVSDPSSVSSLAIEPLSFRDSNNLTVATLMAQLHWMSAGSIAQTQRYPLQDFQQKRLWIDKEVSVVVGAMQCECSLSRLQLLQSTAAALASTHRLASPSGQLNFQGLSSSDANKSELSVGSLESESNLSTNVVFAQTGDLVPLFGEYTSDDIKEIVLHGYKSFSHLLAEEPATFPCFDFWEHFCCYTSCTDRKISKDYFQAENKSASIAFSEAIRKIQINMVTGFKNYRFSEESWRYVVTPAWLGVPRFGSIRAKSHARYTPMGSPVFAGYRVFVDSGTTITSLDKGLMALPLNGIMTARGDRTSSSSKCLQFDVSGPCSVMVCWDIKITKLPMWLMNFGSVTGLYVNTNNSRHVVYIRHVTSSMVSGGEFPATDTLGGCGLYSTNDADNYFVLISKLVPHIGFNSAKDKSFCLSEGAEPDQIAPLDGRKHDDYRWMLSPDSLVEETPNNSCKVEEMQSEDLPNEGVKQSVLPYKSRFTISIHVGEAEFSYWDDSQFRARLYDSAPDLSRPTPKRKESFGIHVDQINFDILLKDFNSMIDIVSRPIEFKCDLVFDISAVANSRLGERDDLFAQVVPSTFMTPTTFHGSFRKNQGTSRIVLDSSLLSAFAIQISPPIARMISNFSFDFGNANRAVRNNSSRADVAMLSLIAVDEQIEKSENDESPYSDSVPTLSKLALSNDLGADIEVIVISELVLIASFGDSEILLNPKALNKDALIPIKLAPNDQLSLTVAEGEDESFIKRIQKHLAATKFRILVDGWTVENAIDVQFSGISLYRIDIDTTYSNDLSVFGDDFTSEHEESGSVRTTAFTAIASTELIEDDFDDNGTWRSCSSEEHDPVKAADPEAPAPCAADHDDDAAPKNNCKSRMRVSKGQSIQKNSFSTTKKNKSKNRALSYAIMVSYTTTSDLDPEAESINNSDVSQRNQRVFMRLQSNVQLLNESKGSIVALCGAGSHCHNKVKLRSQQRTNLPLSSLRVGHLRFHRLSPGLELEGSMASENEFGALCSIALRSEAFDASVSSALRTARENESSGIHIRPRDSLSGELIMQGDDFHLNDDWLQKSKNNSLKAGLVEWEVVVYPMMKITNALPCDIRVQLAQPPKAARRRGELIGMTSKEGARDLFYLPTEFDSKLTVVESDGWRPFEDHQKCELICDTYVNSGESFEIPSLSSRKTLYMRHTIPGTNVWSKFYGVRSEVLRSKYLFCKHKSEDIPWKFTRQQYFKSVTLPQIRMKREWTNVRSIVLLSKYWIVNKSSIDLMYDSKFITSHSMKLGDLEKEAELKDDVELKNTYSKTSQLGFSTVQKSSVEGGSMFAAAVNSHDRKRGEMLTDEISAQISDAQSKLFFGGESIPVLMSCRSRRLRLLPLANRLNRDENRLYVYDLQCANSTEFKRRIVYGINNASSVYGDSVEPMFSTWPESWSQHWDHVVHAQSLDSDKSSDASNINFMTFRVSTGGFVYVAIDSKSEPMSWMKILGFRSTGETIHTSSRFRAEYKLYRKFYSGKAIVHLGGNKKNLGFHNSSMMYLVFVLPSFEYIEPTVDDIYHYNPERAFSVFKTPSSACRQFPGFTIGDTIFTDADCKVKCWSKFFDSIRILAIQTASSDKSSTSENYLSFLLKQPSRVFLCIDFLLLTKSYPEWIARSGYQRMPLTIKAEGVSFHVFSQAFGAELCLFGGLGVPSESYINNYFILIADEFEFQKEWVRDASSNTITLASQEGVGCAQCRTSAVSGIASRFNGEDAAASTSINEFWNGSTAASAQQVPFSELDRSWSKLSIDLKRGNTGEIMAGNVVLAAEVKYLPGIFHRSCLVTLLPRYLVVNLTSIPLTVFPFQEEAPAQSTIQSNPGTNASKPSLDMTFTVRSGETSAMSSFFKFGEHGSGKNEHKNMKRWVRFFQESTISDTTALHDAGHTGSDLINLPICVNDIGDQFTWLQVYLDGKSSLGSGTLLLSVSVVLVRQTVVLTVRDVSQSPPFRIENRLPSVTLQIRQKDTQEWVELPPRSWKSYVWTKYGAPKLLEVKVKGSRERIVTYRMDKIGRVGSFYWSIHNHDTSHESYSSLNGESLSMPHVYDMRKSWESGHVQGFIYADGVTRVLSLCEAPKSRGTIMSAVDFITGAVGDGHHAHENQAIVPNSLRVTPIHARNRRKNKMRNFSTVALSKETSLPSFSSVIQHLHLTASITGIALKLIRIDLPRSTATADVDTNVLTAEKMEYKLINLMDVSFEHAHVDLNGPRYEVCLTIFHVQVDDMRQRARFPVILSPTTSGFNSHLSREGNEIRLTPQFEILFECAPNKQDLLHIKTLEIAIQPLNLRIDMDFVLSLVKFSGSLMQATEEGRGGAAVNSTREAIERRIALSSQSIVQSLLHYTITSRVYRSTNRHFNSLIYVELLHLGMVNVELEIFGGTHLLHADTASLDKTTALGFAGLSSEVSVLLSSLAGSIGHASPTLKFDDVVVSKYFGTPEPLYQFLYTSYKRDALMQSYKVFGSMEVLGDPLSLFDHLGAGVVQLFSRTRAEVIGDSRTRGEGLRQLARAVVGGAAGSASKMTGSLADILSVVTGFEESRIGENDREAFNPLYYLPKDVYKNAGAPANGAGGDSREADRGYVSDQWTRPLTVTQGLHQGSHVMADAVVSGLSSLVEDPIEGMRNEGVVGAAKGVVKGFIKVVASPVVGVLGAVSVITESVELSARYRNGAPVGRRNIGQSYS